MKYAHNNCSFFIHFLRIPLPGCVYDHCSMHSQHISMMMVLLKNFISDRRVCITISLAAFFILFSINFFLSRFVCELKLQQFSFLIFNLSLVLPKQFSTTACDAAVAVSAALNYKYLCKFHSIIVQQEITSMLFVHLMCC